MEPVYENSLKRIGTIVLILFHFSLHAQINCENDTSGYVPIVDLQSDFYMGFQGGLYPGGANILPAAHADSGIAIAQSILPINNNGDEDTVFGKLVMLALGPVDAGKSFNKFVVQYNDAGLGDTCFKIVNACIENYGLEDMLSDESEFLFWADVNDKLQIAEAKKKQVQIVWLMSTSFIDTTLSFPQYADTLKKRYIDVIRELKEQFFNLKIIYISGLHYGGYIKADDPNYHALNEQATYYNDFAIKWTIEAQINGDTLLNYSGDDAKAAWVCWGPNLWADGRNVRDYDGLRWLCPGDFDVADNGYFLSGGGQEKISDRLYDFFTTEPTSTPWIFGLNYPCFPDTIDYADTISVPDDVVVWISPNPAKGVVRFTINIHSEGKADVAVLNMAGQKIREGSFYKIEPEKIFTIKLSEHARGFYILSVLVEGRVYNVPFYLDT